MYRKLSLIACAAVAAFSLTTASADDVISGVMKKYHKAPEGTDPVCKKAGAGAASEAELADLLKAYESLAEVKPPRGDDAAWEQRTADLVAAVKLLQAKDAGGADAYKKAVNCKACHTDHKPD